MHPGWFHHLIDQKETVTYRKLGHNDTDGKPSDQAAPRKPPFKGGFKFSSAYGPPNSSRSERLAPT